MPVMSIGPEEFAALLDKFANEIVKEAPLPVDVESALRAAVRLMAFTAIREKAEVFRALGRRLEQAQRPVEERSVPFRHRVPSGAWLS